MDQLDHIQKTLPEQESAEVSSDASLQHDREENTSELPVPKWVMLSGLVALWNVQIAIGLVVVSLAFSSIQMFLRKG